MKKNKKVYSIITALALSMFVCMGIGQKIVLPTIESKEPSNEEETVIIENENKTDNSISIVNLFDFSSITGYADTIDNPWKTTIGKIELEGEGTCVLMTPNTSIDIPLNTIEVNEFIFYTRIHPLVSMQSDGATLRAQLCDSVGNVISETIIEIKSEEDFKPVIIDLREARNQYTQLKIIATNGKYNDSSCDWIVVKDASIKNDRTGGDEQFYISAHYFADEWPINFWNSEMDNLQSDMKQIKSDGFNSIILVVPWREFQPQTNPITYNPYAFEQLDRILTEAKNVDLGVLVRVGYTWDYYADSKVSSLQRFDDIPGNSELRLAWIGYLNTLYKSLDKHENFVGGFITWEDFWNNTYLPDSIGGKVESIEMSICSEFQKYIKRMYSIEEFNSTFGTEFSTYEAPIYIPSRMEATMEAYYAFYDEWLMNLLNESQNYFPNLSMEVRNDWDSFYDKQGNHAYYKHDATYACGNAGFSALMYGIPQGCENNGERLSWQEALGKTEYILNSFNEANPTKKVFVDQFIFADNTPGVEKNAQIKENEINPYLENVDTILSENTCGIGIWTYKDYTSNLLYNSQFALGYEGWSIKKSKVQKVEGTNCLILSAKGEIKQNIPISRKAFASNTFVLELDAILVEEDEQSAFLEITVGDITETIPIDVNKKRYKITYENPSFYDLIIKSSADIKIDNVDLYNHIQNGFLYDKEGNELDALKGLKSLNNKLQNNEPKGETKQQ